MTDKSVNCMFCKGEMQSYSGPRYSRRFGGYLILGGILCALFWVGAVLGIPLVIIGLYMIGAKRQLWVCKDCNTAIERVALEPNRA
jgi:hypothetical protein